MIWELADSTEKDSQPQTSKDYIDSFRWSVRVWTEPGPFYYRTQSTASFLTPSVSLLQHPWDATGKDTVPPHLQCGVITSYLTKGMEPGITADSVVQGHKAPLGTALPKRMATVPRPSSTNMHTDARAREHTHVLKHILTYALKTMPHRLTKWRKRSRFREGGFCPRVHSCVTLGYVKSHPFWS